MGITRSTRLARYTRFRDAGYGICLYLYLSIYLYLYLYLARMMAAASMVICIAVGRLLSVESNHKAIAGGTGIGQRPRRRQTKPRPSGCDLSITC